jgi:hypothetical protein
MAISRDSSCQDVIVRVETLPTTGLFVLFSFFFQESVFSLQISLLFIDRDELRTRCDSYEKEHLSLCERVSRSNLKSSNYIKR